MRKDKGEATVPHNKKSTTELKYMKRNVHLSYVKR